MRVRRGCVLAVVLLGILWGREEAWGSQRVWDGRLSGEVVRAGNLPAAKGPADGEESPKSLTEDKGQGGSNFPENRLAKGISQEWEPGEDWREIDIFLQKQEGWGQEAVTFSQLVKALMAGKGREAAGGIVKGLGNSLTREVSHGTHLAGELLALGLVGAIFSNFSHIFTGSQISETGFFMTSLLTFTVLVSAFTDSMEIARGVLEGQMEFLKVLIPCYFPAAVWAGGGLSAAAWMEFFLFLIAAVQGVYCRLLLPLTRVYLLLVIAGNMAKEDMLSRLTKLLQSGIRWGMGSLMGLVAGFQLIQGMVLPYADSVQTAGVQKLLQVIPGVGDSAGAVTKMLLGTGVLVKNTMGAAAVAVLIVLSLIPLLKLMVLLLLYRTVAGVLQPVGDKRLVACIESVAEGQKLLLGLAASGLLLFSLTIALVCVGTNGAYLGV